jgi:hypothetical protein
MKTLQSDFFSILGHLSSTKHEEDQLSNTFRACFAYSRTFRHCVLQLLSRRCHIKRRIPDTESWECITQLSQSNRSGRCRYDIHLKHNETRSRKFPFLILESKIRSPLTKRQLKRYRPSSGNRLIAITQRHPDVPTPWLQSRGIAWLRWQDIYRCLAQVKGRAGHERFIQNSFLSYLEAANMAYGELL